MAADLGDLHALLAVVRAVEVAGVDVVDALLHRLAQHRERARAILGRAEDAGAGELHGAVADAPDRAVAEREGAGLVEIELGHEGVPFVWRSM